MAADASAYAVLGLEQGAEWAAVERAYRTLMKIYHPDRPGGDGGRAAEINHAYRELRRARVAAETDGSPWEEYDPGSETPRRSWGWLAATVMIVAVVGLVALVAGPSNSLVAGFRMRAAPPAANFSKVSADATPDQMARPLNGDAIQAGIADGTRLAASQDEAAMAEETRKCNADLRLQPALAKLDRCAAFDDAVVQLQDRDPWRDDGPFSQVAVTGRQTSAANLLSDDYLAIDGRLNRIRLAVELALAQSRPPAQPPADPDG